MTLREKASLAEKAVRSAGAMLEKHGFETIIGG